MAMANQLLELIVKAHNKIIEGKDDIFDAGTTTLLAGVLCRIEDSQDEMTSSVDDFEVAEHTVQDKKWGWIGISVGDCKVFRWSSTTNKVLDLTMSSRLKPQDVNDCGGRLGPTLRNGLPDLSNLGMAFAPCEEGDLFWFVTDGVYDNIDPQHDGRSPQDVGHPAPDWDSMTDEELFQLKSSCYISWFQQIFKEHQEQGATPSDLTHHVIEYCQKLTAPSREWMEQHPGMPLPDDFKTYPGKLDHTTILAVRLHSLPGSGFQRSFSSLVVQKED